MCRVAGGRTQRLLSPTPPSPKDSGFILWACAPAVVQRSQRPRVCGGASDGHTAESRTVWDSFAGDVWWAFRQETLVAGKGIIAEIAPRVSRHGGQHGTKGTRAIYLCTYFPYPLGRPLGPSESQQNRCEVAANSNHTGIASISQRDRNEIAAKEKLR